MSAVLAPSPLVRWRAFIWRQYNPDTHKNYKRRRTCVVCGETTWAPGKDAWSWAWTETHHDTYSVCPACAPLVTRRLNPYAEAAAVHRGPIPPVTCHKCQRPMARARIDVIHTPATLEIMVCLCGWEWYLT